MKKKKGFKNFDFTKLNNLSLRVLPPVTPLKAPVKLTAKVIVDIMCRASVKTLVRLRTVSQSWLALTADERFIRLHLEFNRTRNRKLICSNIRDGKWRHVAYMRLQESAIPVLKVDSRMPDRPNYPRKLNFDDFCKRMFLAGSLDGIVCLSHYAEWMGLFVALWNPSTNHWKPIPLRGPKSETEKGLPTSFGLGYSAVNNDYRLIRIVPFVSLPRYPPLQWSRIKFFSVREGFWEDGNNGDVISFWPKLEHCSFIIKGIPYWTGIDMQLGGGTFYAYHQLEILGSIDPSNGTYRKIEYPQHVKNRETIVYPVNLKDAVTVLIHSPGEHPNQMVDLYQERANNWTKLYSIGPLTFDGLRIPQCFSTGEIVLDAWTGENEACYFCDPKTNQVHHNHNIDAIVPCWYESYNHVESLVCFEGMMQIGKEHMYSRRTNPKKKDWIPVLSKEFNSALRTNAAAR